MKKRNNVKLSKDDLLLIDYLFRHRVASGKNIFRDIFYKYKNFEVSRSRLTCLRKSGLIRGAYYGMNHRDMSYTLTKEAAKRYIDLAASSHLWKATNCPNHDIDLIDIWKSLRSRKEHLFSLTENEYNIREGDKYEGVRLLLGEINPDGYIELKIGENTFIGTVEYERSRKSAPRYMELISKYYLNEDIDFVLYISNEEHIEKLVQRTESKYRTPKQEPKFYYALSKDVVKAEDIYFNSTKKEIPPLLLKQGKQSTTDTTASVVEPVVLKSEQGLENIRNSIVEEFKSRIASTPHTVQVQQTKTKQQITNNEHGELYG